MGLLKHRQTSPSPFPLLLPRCGCRSPRGRDTPSAARMGVTPSNACAPPAPAQRSPGGHPPLGGGFCEPRPVTTRLGDAEQKGRRHFHAWDYPETRAVSAMASGGKTLGGSLNTRDIKPELTASAGADLLSSACSQALQRDGSIQEWEARECDCLASVYVTITGLKLG